MGLIYGAFAILLSIAIFTTINIDRQEKSGIAEVSSWSLVGMVYLMCFVVMMIYNTAPDWMIYIFQVLSCAGFIWQFRILEYKRKFTPPAVPSGVVAFITAWTVMGVYLGMAKFNILLPSVLVLAAMSLMMSAYFFMRTDSEIHLRNIIAGLYAMMSIVKILYIMNGINDDPIYYIGIFVLDFMIYVFIAILIFLNAHYRDLISLSNQGMHINELMTMAPEPMALLSAGGDLLYINDRLKEEANKGDREIRGIEDLFRIYAPGERLDWFAEAVKSFDKGEGCCFPIESDDDTQRYFSCDIFPNGDSYNIFFRIRSYPADGFWIGSGRRSIDALTVHKSDSELEESFSTLVGSCESDQHLGIVLLRVVNADSIEERMGRELYRDFLASFSSRIINTSGIHNISLYNSGTFLMLTDTGSFTDIQEWADGVVQKISEPYRIGDMSVDLLPELGVAVYPDNGQNFGDLVRAAQVAVARNTLGSNEQVQFYDPGYKYLQSDRIDLEDHLKNAVGNGELTMLFQPQAHAKKQDFRGFEALIRWELKDGKHVSPNIFIPMAEDLGLIEEIGFWALEESVRKASEWQKDFGCTFMMSVNISSHQLEQQDIVSQVADLLDTYDYPAANLELEVTESKILRTSKEVYTSLHALKKMGIKIALDDFGTGFSSLDYLRWLPFDVLKIDKSFIDNLGEDVIESEIVYSVIGLVNKMNLETVAEGVENREQLRILQRSGCTYIQGYLYSKPLTDFEAREILLKLE